MKVNDIKTMLEANPQNNQATSAFSKPSCTCSKTQKQPMLQQHHSLLVPTSSKFLASLGQTAYTQKLHVFQQCSLRLPTLILHQLPILDDQETAPATNPESTPSQHPPAHEKPLQSKSKHLHPPMHPAAPSAKPQPPSQQFQFRDEEQTIPTHNQQAPSIQSHNALKIPTKLAQYHP